MELHRDFSDLLREFSSAGVDFLIVGAHALGVHDRARATKDLDVWIRPTRENAERTIRALAAFGAPLAGIRIASMRRGFDVAWDCYRTFTEERRAGLRSVHVRF